MTTDGAAAERSEIGDDEIREWAKATGRKVADRGRVGAGLRAEYTAKVGQLGAGELDAGDPGPFHSPGGTPGAPAADGSTSPGSGRGSEGVSAARPRAARAEQRPRPVKPQASGLGRVKAWFNGATTTGAGAAKKTTPKAKPDRPRTPVTRLVERAWGRAARMAEFVNVPVARTMQWQAPYVGIVVEDVIAATPLDKVLQPFAKAETALSGVGAMVAMPLLVGAITSERFNPETGGLVAVARQQLFHEALAECIDAQLEMFGSRDLAAKILQSAEQQAERSEQIDQIMGMIFAQIPREVELADDATDEDVARAQQQQDANAAAELAMRQAAAAIKFMPPPGTVPDTRGQAAQAAAAQMAAAGASAAAHMPGAA